MLLPAQNAQALFRGCCIGELCRGVGKAGARIFDGKIERNRIERGKAGIFFYGVANVDVALDHAAQNAKRLCGFVTGFDGPGERVKRAGLPPGDSGQHRTHLGRRDLGGRGLAIVTAAPEQGGAGKHQQCCSMGIFHWLSSVNATCCADRRSCVPTVTTISPGLSPL